MNHQDVTVSNMQWCPPLIMVHQIPHPETDMGVTPAFVDPFAIQSIYSAFANDNTGEGRGYTGPCTVIQMRTRDCLYVNESPEVVANLRDAAFGHKHHESTLSVVGEK